MTDETDVEKTLVTEEDPLGEVRRALQTALAENPFLIIMSGPEKGKKILLAAGSVTIGRAADNVIRLNDSLISSHHARIECSDGKIIVRDMGSRNGVWINGRKIDSRVLTNGARIVFGSTEVMVTIPGAKSAWDV